MFSLLKLADVCSVFTVIRNPASCTDVSSIATKNQFSVVGKCLNAVNNSRCLHICSSLRNDPFQGGFEIGVVQTNLVGELGVLGIGLSQGLRVEPESLTRFGEHIELSLRDSLYRVQADVHTSESLDLNKSVVGASLAIPPLEGAYRNKLVFTGSHVHQANLVAHSSLRIEDVVGVVPGVGVDVVHCAPPYRVP